MGYQVDQLQPEDEEEEEDDQEIKLDEENIEEYMYHFEGNLGKFEGRFWRGSP